MYKMRFLLPSLNSLVTFEAASRHASFSDAAEELSITREAVSRQIRTLEDYLGVLLFDREKRGISLNSVGAQYADSIRPHLEELAHLSNRLIKSGEPEQLPEMRRTVEEADDDGKPRVLIVDDEAVNIRILDGMLKDAFITLAERDPTKIMQRLIKDPEIDLVLLDINMPGMDGLEVCRQIRSASVTSDLPILLLTSSNDTATELAGLAAGANDFVGRPVEREILLARMRTLINYKRVKDNLAGLLAARTQRLRDLRSTLETGVELATMSDRS
jgi:CheY-like chemotaxis protein/biotin operon repressor